MGWQQHGDCAYSPQINDAGILPYGGYDEWYIFSHPTDLAAIEVFVNYMTFSLQEPEEAYLAQATPIIAGVSISDWIAAQQHEQARFWQQIHTIAPETYLAEGSQLFKS